MTDLISPQLSMFIANEIDHTDLKHLNDIINVPHSQYMESIFVY